MAVFSAILLYGVVAPAGIGVGGRNISVAEKVVGQPLLHGTFLERPLNGLSICVSCGASAMAKGVSNLKKPRKCF